MLLKLRRRMKSIIIRLLLMALAYIVPAYKCFRAVEEDRPHVGSLIFWCEYWIILSVFTVLERVADTFMSWFPFYGEAKLVFVVYLWSPSMQGKYYVYNTLLETFIARHEVEIDHYLNKVKETTTAMVDMLSHKALAYIQLWVSNYPLQIGRLQEVAEQCVDTMSVPGFSGFNPKPESARDDSIVANPGFSSFNPEPEIAHDEGILVDEQKTTDELEEHSDQQPVLSQVNQESVAPTCIVSNQPGTSPTWLTLIIKCFCCKRV